jgi:nucleotide-binding universal stress UspA family protein
MKPIRNVLVARDFSPCSERALETALALADRAGATLHVVHADVLHADPYGQPDEAAGAVDKLRERLKKDVERDRDEGARFDPGGARIEHAVVRDVAAAPALIRYVGEHDVDLLVMGTHGRKGLRRVLLGSVAEEVIRWVPCPVLAMRADCALGEEVRSVLVPVDFSESSGAAVRQAVRLARLWGARLDLLHVGETVPVPSFYDTGFLAYEYGPKFAEHTAEQLRGLVDDVVAEAPGAAPEVAAHVGVGQAPSVIVEEAKRLRSDVVVMGTRGLSGLKHLLLGSVAERVLRTAPCPVLVVKSEEDVERSESLAGDREPGPEGQT